MRLWHYKLIPVLPDKMLVAEWRECIAIKRQWEKGTLKHRLVSYVMDYDKDYFMHYVDLVIEELYKRNIKHQYKYEIELRKFCNYKVSNNMYEEHNNRYLRQCISNLEEKFDRGIISREEWVKIIDYYKEILEGKR